MSMLSKINAENCEFPAKIKVIELGDNLMYNTHWDNDHYIYNEIKNEWEREEFYTSEMVKVKYPFFKRIWKWIISADTEYKEVITWKNESRKRTIEDLFVLMDIYSISYVTYCFTEDNISVIDVVCWNLNKELVSMDYTELTKFCEKEGLLVYPKVFEQKFQSLSKFQYKVKDMMNNQNLYPIIIN